MKSKQDVRRRTNSSVDAIFYLKRICIVGMPSVGLASFVYYLNNYRTDLKLFQRQSMIAAGCGYVLSQFFSFIYTSQRIRNKNLIRVVISNIVFFLPAYFAKSSSKFDDKTNKIINYTCLGLSIVGHLYKIYINEFVGDVLYLSAWSALSRDYKPLLISVLSTYIQNIFIKKKRVKISDKQLPALQEKVNKKEERHRFSAKLPKQHHLRCMGREMAVIRDLCKGKNIIDDDKKEKDLNLDDRLIKNVCLIVVGDEVLKPIMKKYKFAENTELSAKFENLGIVSSGKVKNLNIDIIKVAESKVFRRHYSGYTQASALAALVSYHVKPDIVISFGYAGGITFISKSQYRLGQKSAFFDEDDGESSSSSDEECSDDDIVDQVEIGDVVLGEACLFLDRLRTRNKNAFDWGIWGGSSIQTNNLIKDIGLIKGIIGSQIGYMVNEFQSELIGNANIIALDMESASIAQILNQTGINFLALKVISNGIYPKNPGKMESEFHENMEMVSKKATEILVKVIDYLNDKRINQL